MALRVEVAGYGLCQTTAPYSVFVVCVQQEKFEAWTVYRRYNSFQLLREQLITLHPSIPVIPNFDTENLKLDNLESCRSILDRWLQIVASNSYILRMQSMYQFLCIDANMPPPYLEIHWRDSSNESFEEMEMDDMFDREMDDGEMHNEEDEDEEEQGWEDGSNQKHSENKQSTSSNQSVFAFQQLSTTTTTLPPKAAPAKRACTNLQVRSSNSQQTQQQQQQQLGSQQIDDIDGFDIHSLSTGEVEFIYDKTDDEKSRTGSSSKRTINLEAFKIIRVIGKGNGY